MTGTVIISPHLDDACLSLGQWIAAHHDVTIVTVFAGVPGELPLTHYDAQCGFGSGKEAMCARMIEDADAALVLGARKVHMGYMDQQYGVANDMDQAHVDLGAILRGADRVLVPLGLVHADHVAVSSMGLTMADMVGVPFAFYEELPYRVLHPELTAERLHGIRTFHDIETSPETIGERSRKIAALGCYRSQVPDPLEPTLLVPERIWSVS